MSPTSITNVPWMRRKLSRNLWSNGIAEDAQGDQPVEELVDPQKPKRQSQPIGNNRNTGSLNLADD